jgi:predicted porin
MKNQIKLAVAGAVLSAASVANAGIIIPAGDWTLDINGNVNAFANWTNYDTKAANDAANLSGATAGGLVAGADTTGEDSTQGINTGLLPAWLGFTGTTRQNDVDVSFTISFQPNVSDNFSHGDAKTPLNRQAFVTFGDKSWGTVKMGKDLGIFAGNAILNDMTLLGVGGGASTVSGTFTSLGGIGTGYIYPAWKGQVSYTTPNFNGITATVAITNPNQHQDASVNSAYQDRFGVEGQVQYAFDAGKVWVSGASYKYRDGNEAAAIEWDATAIDIGAAVNMGNLGLVAYYYDAEGAGTTMWGGWKGGGPAGSDGGVGTTGNERDSDGGYVQATYVIPSGTKLGVAYGVSNLDRADSNDTTAMVEENKRWTVGAYHPLTKHLNLVAEYNNIESSDHAGNNNESDAISLGAILFF